jgi:hypothetical protein
LPYARCRPDAWEKPYASPDFFLPPDTADAKSRHFCGEEPRFIDLGFDWDAFRNLSKVARGAEQQAIVIAIREAF